MDPTGARESDPLFGRHRTQEHEFSSTDELSLPNTYTNPVDPKSIMKRAQRCIVAVAWFVPGLRWMCEYRKEHLLGDFLAATTVSAVYAPLSISFALLSHGQPSSGLRSFVVCSVVYAFVGSSPQMIIGPEAPGSVLVGSAVTLARDSAMGPDPLVDARLAGLVTATAGAVLFLAGVTRTGFIECVLNRPFMKGFILALGVSVVVDQALIMLALSEAVRENAEVASGSVVNKLYFILSHFEDIQTLTALVSISSFTAIMTFRKIKVWLRSSRPWISLLPDRLIIVLCSGWLTWLLDWQRQGLDILGPLDTSKQPGTIMQWPFQLSNRKSFSKILGSCMTLAIVGFFESVLTMKTLRKLAMAESNQSASGNSTNQELIALGVANIAAGCFSAIPSFGGYGRSKLNFSAGGRTHMSSLFISGIMLACQLFLLQAFYYVPKCVLAALVAEVGISMIEECPYEIGFFVRVRGWSELLLIGIVFGVAAFHSITLGMVVGVLVSLLVLIRDSSLANMSLLEEDIPNETFLGEPINCKPRCPDNVVFINIAGPLTFANSANFEYCVERLERLQICTKPSRLRSMESQKARSGHIILFSFHDSATIDNCALLTLREMERERVSSGKKVLFLCPESFPNRQHVFRKLSLSGILERSGGSSSFLGSTTELLDATGSYEQSRDGIPVM